MSHNLYFIPILAKELAKADLEKSLDSAFALIEQLGRQQIYTEGYRNFCRFMSESFARRQQVDEQTVRNAMLSHVESTATETKVCDLHDQIQKDKSLRFKEEHEALCREFELSTERIWIPTFHVICNGRELEQVNFPPQPGCQTVEEISPGHYTLKLDSGLVVWEGQLNARDLIWTQAFGERDLELPGAVIEIKGDSLELPPTLMQARMLNTDWTRFSKYSACLDAHSDKPGMIGRLSPSGRICDF